METQFAARLRSEQRMRQFLADASHELRTPLTSIRGYAELARLQRDQLSAEPRRRQLDRIEAEGTRMSRLVDDLLTLARSDRGAGLRREWIDVDELLDEAVGGVRAAYPARRIELSVPAGLDVIGDPRPAVRVVRNLVTNAAVHTRPDGPIRCRPPPRDGAVADAAGRRSPAPACRRKRRRTCSNGSGGPTRPEPERAAAAGSAWPSSPRSCRPTAARSASTARCAAGSTVTVQLPLAPA